MSQELESNYNKMVPIMRMLVPMVGGKDGLKKMIGSNPQLLKDAIKKFLNTKKEEHKVIFEKGGYQAISFCLVGFSGSTGFMLFAFKFKKGIEAPICSKPLEIIEVEDFINKLIEAIPLDEMAKDL